MITFVCLFTIALCAGTGGHAQSITTTPSYELHSYLSSGVQHGYLGKRVSRNIYPGLMLWSELDCDLPCHAFLNVWDSTKLDNGAGHGGDELDLTFGFQGKLGDYNVKISSSLLNVYPLDKWWNGDIAVQSLFVSRDFKLGDHTIQPEMRVEWTAKTDDFGGGALILMPSVTDIWSHPFGIKRLTFVQKATVAWDDGFNGAGNNSSGVFAYGDWSLNWELTKHISVTLPSIGLIIPLHDAHDGRNKTEPTFGASLTFRF